MLEYVLIGAGIVGFLAVGGLLALRLYNNPLLLVGLGTAVWRELWPVIWRLVSKRKSPEEEAEWRREQLSGIKPPPKGTGVTTKQPAAKRKT